MNNVSLSAWNTARAKAVALFPQLSGLDDRRLAFGAGRLYFDSLKCVDYLNCVDSMNCVDLWILWKVAEGATIDRGECEAQR